MKLKKFEEHSSVNEKLNENLTITGRIVGTEQLNEENVNEEGVKDMKIKFYDDDDLGYMAYLYITSSSGKKYYTMLKDERQDEYEDNE